VQISTPKASTLRSGRVSQKNELKAKQKDNKLHESTSNDKSNKQTEVIDKGQKTLKQMMNKNKQVQANHAIVDKENNDVREEHHGNK
jgi:hypothetical protein